MDSRLPLPSREYWYSGSPNPAVDNLFRRVCVLAWPYALYCATRYLRDVHAAYDLMDAAVANANQRWNRLAVIRKRIVSSRGIAYRRERERTVCLREIRNRLLLPENWIYNRDNAQN